MKRNNNHNRPHKNSFIRKFLGGENVIQRIKPVMIAFSFLLFALLYIGTIKGIQGNPKGSDIKQLEQATQPFELSPERGRFAHTYALAENKSFSLSKQLADAVYPDVGYVDGRFYSFFAPGVSILALPLYIIGKYFNLAQVFTYSVSAIFAMGTILFLYRIGRDIFRLQSINALIAPIIFGFGSTSWSYATTLYQHHVTTFFVISSIYAVWKFNQNTKNSYLWALYVWFSYAAAFTVDYPNLVFLLPVMVYFFLSALKASIERNKLTITLRPAFILTCISFLIITALHGMYNQTQFGDWKQLSGGLVGYRDFRHIEESGKTVTEEQLQEIASNKNATFFFQEERLPSGIYTLLFAPDKGIFIFSPLFILGIVSIIALRREIDQTKAILLSLIGVNIFLYASFGDPWGGWAFGPRYLILTMAVLSLFISVWLSKVKHILLAKIAVFILFAVSAAIALQGVLTTNAVPPKVEADHLHMKYGIPHTLDFFMDGRSSSYLYNTFFAEHMSLQSYFLLLYLSLIITFAVILVLIPKRRVYEV